MPDRPPLGAARAPRALFSCLAVGAFLAASTVETPASAEGPYNSSEAPGEEHGSQVASSEWLPIVIGCAAGVTIGALTGSAVDDSQPATWGPILGGVVGGLAGGGGGAWFIRNIREQDTRVAGTVTGGALGLGVGLGLFARTEDIYWRLPGLILLPAMGAAVGHKLAVTFMGKHKSETSSVAIHTLQPSIVPLAGRGGTGLTVGVGGSFF